MAQVQSTVGRPKPKPKQWRTASSYAARRLSISADRAMSAGATIWPVPRHCTGKQPSSVARPQAIAPADGPAILN